ncbi:carbohydrate-binding protein, partial [Klebsiella quasipneumoniae]
EWNPETMVLFRDDYRQLQLGHTYYYRVTAKNESGRSAPSNVISVQHSEENQPPVVTLEPALTTTQDQGVELTANCHADRAQTRAWFTAPGTYALTFTADDGLLKSSKTVTVTVGEATGKAPADFCRYHGEVYGVAEGRLTVMKSDKDALTVGEDGFLGPFANEGDKVSWQVQAPWSGQFLLNVTFNGKW